MRDMVSSIEKGALRAAGSLRQHGSHV